MKIDLKILSIFAFILFTQIACSTGGKSGKGGSDGSVYMAHSIIYNLSPTPRVTERDFESHLTIASSGKLTSYSFDNYLDRSSKTPDSSVLLAISGAAGGFGIYDSFGRPLVEYPKGKVIGRAVIFERKTQNGRQSVKWYIGEKSIASVIEAYDTKGVLVQSEVTTYVKR